MIFRTSKLKRHKVLFRFYVVVFIQRQYAIKGLQSCRSNNLLCGLIYLMLITGFIKLTKFIHILIHYLLECTVIYNSARDCWWSALSRSVVRVTVRDIRFLLKSSYAEESFVWPSFWREAWLTRPHNTVQEQFKLDVIPIFNRKPFSNLEKV